MSRPNLTLAIALLCGAAWLSAPNPAAAAEITPERIFPNLKLDRPVQLVIPPDGTNRRFLVQQKGIVHILPDDESSGETETFLDLTDRPLIDNAFEEGLLGLAFHPEFTENAKFYIYYTLQNPKRSRLSEFKVAGDTANRADADSERVLLEVPQPFWNHNSGNILFGPDGYLYIALGDGGKRDDPHKLAQNLWVLNGKILRIDVDGRDGALEYAIPDDNPFAKTDGVRPEIYAYGLRNPWGLYFDKDGRFWVADVGQDLYEEINLVEPGENYGWNFREGLHEFAQRPHDPPAEAKFVDPIHEYSHADGLSITGGVIYRGKAIPELAGTYLFGDFANGALWAMKHDGGQPAEVVRLRDASPGGQFKPTAFNEDIDGEVVVLSWDGALYKLASEG